MGTERERVENFGRLEDGLRQGGEWYRWGGWGSNPRPADYESAALTG